MPVTHLSKSSPPPKKTPACCAAGSSWPGEVNRGWFLVLHRHPGYLHTQKCGCWRGTATVWCTAGAGDCAACGVWCAAAAGGQPGGLVGLQAQAQQVQSSHRRRCLGCGWQSVPVSNSMTNTTNGTPNDAWRLQNFTEGSAKQPLSCANK
jgi:hypothetical protein